MELAVIEALTESVPRWTWKVFEIGGNFLDVNWSVTRELGRDNCKVYGVSSPTEGERTKD